ncbi:dTDP-4-dehydrorhamnose reductase [Companilactobacillus allii]|uniref:dTDP-4-dehydrorhamnose reductase n=1 Tax=Companilactobacillus allii TaxID=1847728 RepID=A0A1P8Q258_9LACO|nr:dTDP-4-dehydrorhamnose reductase [Companilactobacillus allii]APX71964.1 dTDP-4-dehydrorhamnose reductase [Companilactobacillus allii]USQ69060.1 dTDP-4-dehydrorhamnose reductase [Companilactobacillus allii]
MKILITGAYGQLGTELRYLLDEKNIEYVGTDSKELDITDKNSVDKYFDENRPEVVYHCAAYTAVDSAEEEPGKTIDYDVNAIGTRNIVEAAERVGATLIYISTDYVFDGTKDGMYTEDDTPNPKNEYGRTKLLGEQAVEEIMSKYYIIRTSWVFGEYGKNFVYTMLNLAKTHDHLTVVDDQIGRPTWTRTLAEFMLYAVQNNVDYGLYQLSNEGSCSWYEFATEILKDKDVDVSPVTSEQYPQKAYRPKHSVMNLRKIDSTGYDIIGWKDALLNLKSDL